MKDRIRQVREELGASQKEFADKLNVSREAVAQWERGVKNPSATVLRLIEKEYGVSADWILTGDGEKKRDYRDVQREILVAMFNQLPEERQKAINDVLEYYVKHGKSPYAE